MINWLPLLEGRLGSATEGGIEFTETPTVDPLKKAVVAKFRNPIPNRACWAAFQLIVHAFATVNDCAVQKIWKASERKYIIEILIKDLRRSSMRDPFIDDWKSRGQRRREEFQKYLRDKAEELKKEVSDEPEPTSPLPSDINLWNR